MKRLFKYLFKYDFLDNFLDNNKGISSAISAIIILASICVSKYSTLSLMSVSIIGATLIFVLYAICDKWLAKKNLNDNQLSLLNKIGWAMYCVCLIVAGYMLFWLL